MGAIIESRVDWLTATSSHGQGADELLNKGLEVINHYVSKGGTRSNWAWQGYAGTRCEHIAVGWRLDGCCIRLGGIPAGDNWIHMVALAGHVSRIDLAVTIQADPGAGGLARAAYRESVENKPRSGRKAESTLIVSSRGGETTYIGQRISHRFLRIYNKHAESGGIYPRGTWRYEVEYKQDLAEVVARGLALTSDIPQSIANTLHEEFTRQGVAPPWPFSDSNALQPRQIRDPTDNERRLAWLQSSVRSTIENLSSSVSEREILKALGIWYPLREEDALGQVADLYNIAAG